MQPWMPLVKVEVLSLRSRLSTGLKLIPGFPGVCCPNAKKREKLCQRPGWICNCSPNKLIQRSHFCCLIETQKVLSSEYIMMLRAYVGHIQNVDIYSKTPFVHHQCCPLGPVLTRNLPNPSSVIFFYN